MKIKIVACDIEEETITIACSNSKDAHIKALYQHIQAFEQKLKVRDGSETIMVSPQLILYGEYVNRSIFLYTKEDVFPTSINGERILISIYYASMLRKALFAQCKQEEL